MTLRFYTQLVDAMRLSVVLVILFNPLGPALAEALRGDKLSTGRSTICSFQEAPPTLLRGLVCWSRASKRPSMWW